MKNADNFPELIKRLSDLKKRLAESKTREEAIALLIEFHTILTEAEELARNSN
jgi:hypothetical protein